MVAAAVLLIVPACSSASTDTTAAGSDAVETTAAEGTTTTGPQAAATTQATERSTTTTTEPAAAGTLEDPIPAGTWATVGTVDAVVLATQPNATEVVLADNEFNEEPAPGNRFVIWRVAVANAGDEPTPLIAELSFSVVGPSAVAYDASSYCGVIPDEFDAFREVFPGGTVEGNLCWEVAEEDADGLVLLIDEFAFSSDRAVFAAAGTDVPLAVEYPVPAVPDGDGPSGSRGNPIELGEAVAVADWNVTVTGVIEDATADVLAENTFNEPPADGRQFFIVTIEATYDGAASDMLFASTLFNVVGPRAVSYTGADSCGVIPNELDAFSEVFPGGTVVGNLCWSVHNDDVDGLVFYVQQSFAFDSEPIFVALR
jgi:hypothetical protein